VVSPPAAALRAWWAVAVFSLAGLVSTLDRKILGTLVDPVRHDLGISDTEVALLQGASFSIVYAIMNVPMGLLADRASRRRLIIFGISLWSAATLAGGLAASFGWLFATRMLVGIGEASLSPAVVSMVADLLPPARRGRALSMFLMAQTLGTAASIMIAGALLEWIPDGMPASWPLVGGLAAWRMTFVVCGAIGFVVVAMMGTVPEPARSGVAINLGAERKYAPAFSYLWRHAGVFLPLYLGFAALAIANYGMQAWSPALLMRRFALSPGEVATDLGTVTMAAGLAGAVLGGLVSDRLDALGRRDSKLLILIAACALGLPGTLVAFAGGPWVAISILAFWMMCFPLCGTAVVVALQDMVPNDMRGVTTSLVSVFGTFIGFSLGALLIALTTECLFRDPAMVGRSMTVVMLPSVVLGAGLFWTAYRNVRARLSESAELQAVMAHGARKQ
jgi:MFS family permease